MSSDNRGSNCQPHNLNPAQVAIRDLKPLSRETRRHPGRQIEKLTESLTRFGFVLPVVIDEQQRVIAGWALVQAAEKLLMSHVPAVTVAGMSDAQLRTLRLALNRLTEEASWDPAELKLELEEIIQLDASFEITLTGFEMGEIDVILQDDATEPAEPPAPPPDRSKPAITQPGDLWCLGNHRLLCGNALEGESYAALLGEEQVRAVISDPPFNVRIGGHVSGKGRTVHSEFAMASGEMSESEFTEFLATVIRHMAHHSVDGALHYLFMDFRHLYELMSAGRGHYSELKNLCVWSKTNAGMGSFYRSQHELVAVYKVGKAPHVNNVQLGRHGRNRSNVWTYAGANTFRAGRMDDLEAHPTVKPVSLIADAIRDCTHRSDAVLDPFIGSGTTLLACEQTGRIGYGMELDPYYTDVAIRRWQTMTGQPAVHAKSKFTFDELN